MSNTSENYLNMINSPDDLKRLDVDKLDGLANQIRQFLIQKVSKTGGHLASNLGVVELTMALHLVFDTNRDRVVWDVGHQSYVHKLLTGRRDGFDMLRKEGGMSGFPKTKESNHDAFNTGHSSTSISSGLGMAKARDIMGDDYKVISVIGDGALTGGMAFEALNDAGRSPNDLIVILNDNEMSISKNVGGMSSYLSKIRTEPFYFKVKEDVDVLLEKLPSSIRSSASKAMHAFKDGIKYLILPGILFEELGFKYLGPVDGHDTTALKECLNRAKGLKGPVLIHALTQKGKGYFPAEASPHLFHGVSPFEVETGEVLSKGKKSFSDVFGQTLSSIAKKRDDVVAITAAMPHGTGLASFSREFPQRFFDVGIAEQHAVTFAAGLAASSVVPVFAVYSSFLQRAYDQVLHDVAIQNLHVVFGIDRAGIVGEDGETHHGIYDISYLRHIPNMTILAPSDYNELEDMLKFSIYKCDGPVAIRYPRGKGQEGLSTRTDLMLGKGVRIRQGEDLSIVAVGSMLEGAIKVCDMLESVGVSVDLINARFIKPLDEDLILESVSKTKKLAVLEDNAMLGGFGSSILELLSKADLKDVETKLFAYPDKFIGHGTMNQIYEKYGLLPENIYNSIIELFEVKVSAKGFGMVV